MAAKQSADTLNMEQLKQFRDLELLARQVVEGFIVGLHKSPFHGFSVEFAEHRLYNKGESTRHIDWKLYGRTDKLFIKRYEEETNLRCQLVIDTSSSMNFPDAATGKLRFSAYAAASIATMLKSQRDAVGLTLFSDTVEKMLPARSSGLHHKLLLTELEHLLSGTAQNKKTSAASALHEVAERIHKRSMVAIFSDMWQPGTDLNEIFGALQHLKFNKHEVILFHTLDKRLEQDLELENRPYMLIDMETGQRVKLNPLEVREQYVKETTAYVNALRERCAQYKIDYVEADISKGFRQVLLPYLVKRRKMER